MLDKKERNWVLIISGVIFCLLGGVLIYYGLCVISILLFIVPSIILIFLGLFSFLEMKGLILDREVYEEKEIIYQFPGIPIDLRRYRKKKDEEEGETKP